MYVFLSYIPKTIPKGYNIQKLNPSCVLALGPVQQLYEDFSLQALPIPPPPHFQQIFLSQQFSMALNC